MKPVMIEPGLAKKAFVKHSFLNEDFVRVAVLWAIEKQKVEWIDRKHFAVKTVRKTNGKFVQITIWVHDREDCYWVGKIHAESMR